jgi:nucleoid-associated protein YgaU
MPSQNTLVWAGAAAAAIVIAGASALYWSHPDFLWWNAAGARIVGYVPAEPQSPGALTEPKQQSVPQAPPATQAPPAPLSVKPPAGPAFDVVNVDPTGEAVIAGRAAPEAKVELRDAGKTVAMATADASGQFVIIPPALTPGDHNLSLAAKADNGEMASSNTVAVSVPAPATKVAVAAGTPDANAAVATPTPANPNPAPSALGIRTLATPAPAAGSRVAIQSVEGDSGGGLLAKGSADPHATVRLYLNQADVAVAKTQSDGHWSLTIKGGMTPGGYVIQADQLNQGSPTVVASANTPFEYPDTAAPPPSTVPSPRAEPALAPSPADPVVASVQTKRIATGHTLWALSKTYYGDPTHYPVIYEANRAQIHNPNVIFPGQVFVVPKPEAKP